MAVLEKDLDKKFDTKYKALNAEQRDAVDTIEGPVMVIAGPGTGKTSILTLRIANILRLTDTPPSGILAITYTDAGVKSMRMKLRDVIGTRADEVRIHTFHGFAASIISEFPEHFPALSRAKQMSEPEAMELIREIINGGAKNNAKGDAKKFAPLRPLGDPELYIDKILGTISEAKREAWTPDMLRDFATKEIKRIQNDEDSISTRGETKGKLKADALKRIEKCEKTVLVADVYALYDEKKRADKKMDYDDLIFELVSALKNDELLLRLVQEKFLYILVDEHQDTNDSQNLIVRTIADFFENPNLFVVGDEKQAIYRFQGASVENFLTFQNIWPSMKVISLANNYRSHQSILDASFALIEGNYAEGEHEKLRVRLNAGNKNAKENQRPIDIVEAGNTEAAEEYLVGELRTRLADFVAAKTPDKTVAIIVRRNADVYKLSRLLKSAGIEAAAERGANIFSHPVGILFFELISFVADNSRTEALAKTLVGGLWGTAGDGSHNFNLSERATLIKSIRAGDLSVVSKSISELVELQRVISKSAPIEFIIRAAGLSGLSNLAIKDALSTEVWRSIVALCQDLATKDSIDDPGKLIEALENYRIAAESKNIKIAVGLPDCNIRIMTAHSSKGLEFDYVYAMYTVEESWMTGAHRSYFIMPRERDDSDSIRDSRRLFYVALTRAKLHAAIIYSLEDDNGKQLSPLRFISELDKKHIAQTSVPASHTRIVGAVESIDAAKKSEISERAKYAESVLMERGLSVTALNHFLECPNQFYIKSILRLPEPPTSSSEKGTAMHEAISMVWRLEDRNLKSIEKTLEEGVREYLKRSLLHTHEKEQVLDELLKDIPNIAKSLLGHFSATTDGSSPIVAKVSTEKWIEIAFDKISIHGKLDTIIEGENTVEVFDYKTRKAMSPAAIKGETKNDNGNYFRQLVFYTMLLRGQSVYKNKKISASLVFIRPDEKGRCQIVSLPVTEADIEKVKAEIASLIDSVWTGKIASSRCDNPECEWCALIQ